MDPRIGSSIPKQPSPGDLILHCGHILRMKKFNYYTPKGLTYKRPDGSSHLAHWVTICEECHRAIDGDPSRIKVRGDGVWEGPEPEEKT